MTTEPVSVAGKQLLVVEDDRLVLAMLVEGLADDGEAGATGRHVVRKNEVDDAIRWSQTITDRPCVLDFVVTEEENVYPMIPSGKSF